MDYVWLSFRISWLLSNTFEMVSYVTQLAFPMASLAMAWSWLSSILYFGLEFALLTLMYLIQLLKQNPQRMESKKHGYCWLKELSLAHSDHVCFKRFLLTACLSSCQDKTFLLLFHFRRGKMEAKVLTLTWQFQIVSLDLVSFGDFLWKWF